ncbi:MAG: hypothetical protein PWQ49_898 [Methanohalophilus sp.]|nr:hypothetical protein [Methanohalophilus sp.]
MTIAKKVTVVIILIINVGWFCSIYPLPLKYFCKLIDVIQERYLYRCLYFLPFNSLPDVDSLGHIDKTYQQVDLVPDK